MNPVKHWIKDFFVLSHSQVNGFIILIPLLLIILFSEPVWHSYVASREEDNSQDLALLDSIAKNFESKLSMAESDAIDSVTIHLVKFNPNEISTDGLRSLGFSSVMATRIERYRNKGGRFKIKSDLLKLYGMDSILYNRLFAFVDLPEKREFGKRWERTDTDRKKVEFKREARKENSIERFDINLADTVQLKSIRGIGEKLSQRIIKYRDALGGFITTEQFGEVFGLDSTVVKKLKERAFVQNGFSPRKLNINTLDEKTLGIHPYLRKTVARSIVAYRFQHGEFKTLEDIRSIHTLEDNTIEKILPYLTVDK